MFKRIALVFLAFLCLSMVASVQAESTQHMRLRLHKLVEDYVAIQELNQANNNHSFGSYRRCPDGELQHVLIPCSH